MTKLHAGESLIPMHTGFRGLHGVGCSRASTSFRRRCTWRSGATANIRAGLSARNSNSRLEQTGKTRKRGTKITFKPDTQIFDTTVFSFDKLSERLREKAFLNKGIRITIKDEREEPSVRTSFTTKGGIASL